MLEENSSCSVKTEKKCILGSIVYPLDTRPSASSSSSAMDDFVITSLCTVTAQSLNTYQGDASQSPGTVTSLAPLYTVASRNHSSTTNTESDNRAALVSLLPLTSSATSSSTYTRPACVATPITTSPPCADQLTLPLVLNSEQTQTVYIISNDTPDTIIRQLSCCTPNIIELQSHIPTSLSIQDDASSAILDSVITDSEFTSACVNSTESDVTLQDSSGHILSVSNITHDSDDFYEDDDIKPLINTNSVTMETVTSNVTMEAASVCTLTSHARLKSLLRVSDDTNFDVSALCDAKLGSVDQLLHLSGLSQHTPQSSTMSEQPQQQQHPVPESTHTHTAVHHHTAVREASHTAVRVNTDEHITSPPPQSVAATHAHSWRLQSRTQHASSAEQLSLLAYVTAAHTTADSACVQPSARAHPPRYSVLEPPSHARHTTSAVSVPIRVCESVSESGFASGTNCLYSLADDDKEAGALITPQNSVRDALVHAKHGKGGLHVLTSGGIGPLLNATVMQCSLAVTSPSAPQGTVAPAKHWGCVTSDTSADKFQCEFCDVTFKCKAHMSRHRRSHTNERPHVCSVCYKGFIRREHLYRHLKIHEEPPLEPPPRHPCDLCGSTFLRREHLNRHRKTHSGKREHSCCICGKSFFRREHVRKHMLSHTRALKAGKTVCSRVGHEGHTSGDMSPATSGPVSLISFLPRSHHVHSQHRSPFGANLTTRPDLVSGLQRDNGGDSAMTMKMLARGEQMAADFSVAEMSTDNSSVSTASSQSSDTADFRLSLSCPLPSASEDLSAHYFKYLSLVPPYTSLPSTTGIVSLTSSCLTTLVTSVASSSPTKRTAVTSAKLFECNECGRCFARKEHLQRHTNTHTGFRAFTCETCGRSFFRKEHLRKHQRNPSVCYQQFNQTQTRSESVHILPRLLATTASSPCLFPAIRAPHTVCTPPSSVCLSALFVSGSRQPLSLGPSSYLDEEHLPSAVSVRRRITPRNRPAQRVTEAASHTPPVAACVSAAIVHLSAPSALSIHPIYSSPVVSSPTLLLSTEFVQSIVEGEGGINGQLPTEDKSSPTDLVHHSVLAQELESLATTSVSTDITATTSSSSMLVDQHYGALTSPQGL